MQGEVFSTQNILWIISPGSGIRNFSSLLTQRKLLSRNTFCPKGKEVYLRWPLGREFWMRIGRWFPFRFVLFFGSMYDILWERMYLRTKLFEAVLKKVHGSSLRLLSGVLAFTVNGENYGHFTANNSFFSVWGYEENFLSSLFLRLTVKFCQVYV